MSDLMKVVWERSLRYDWLGRNQSSTGSQTISGTNPATGLTDSTKVLGGDEHHDRLFWKNLVDVGWKKNIIDANGWAGAVQIVILHDRCGKVLESRQLNGMSEEQAERLGSTGYVTKLIATHKARGKCKAIPDPCFKCNGEGILQSGEECDC